jgi:isoleucyl-tRNA synthetase
VVSNGLVLDKNGQKMSKRLGNAIDPFETLQKYGPDATRWYMISNANPWENLKFDLEGIDEVRRKFFGTFTTRILSSVCMRMLMDLIILKKKLKTDQKSTDGFYLN